MRRSRGTGTRATAKRDRSSGAPAPERQEQALLPYRGGRPGHRRARACPSPMMHRDQEVSPTVVMQHRDSGAPVLTNKDAMQAKILIVEDERDIVELLRYNLQAAGFKTDYVRNGADALRRAVEKPPDLILLDLMLPEVDGLIVCSLLKSDPRTKNVPIVMLTAKIEEEDRVKGLELGADDYIPKPFSPREVVLRVAAVLRRIKIGQESEETQKIQTQGLVIDLDKHQVLAADKTIELTATEFKLITLFARSPGRVFTRDILMEVIWGQDYYGIDRTVDTHVSRLRRKLGELGKHIETVHGVGYRFREV